MSVLPHLLIVDDDPEICQLVKESIEPHGFRVVTAADGKGMRRVLAQSTIDLVILDLMLPGEDGLSLCRELQAGPRLPVIFLTAAGSEADRVVGLEMGADDYLAKPFSSRELLARVRAVLRRTGGAGQAGDGAPRGRRFHFAGWTLDSAKRCLYAPDGVLVELSGGEYELLLAFLKNPQAVLNRDQLLDQARGRMAGPYDRSIDVQIGRLRRKIEPDAKNPELIKTVRGGGYVLATNVDIK